LFLPVRGVPDTNWATSREAGQVVEVLFWQIAFAADTVGRSQRTLLRHVTEKSDEGFSLCQMAEA
jgi:hypothetical protein